MFWHLYAANDSSRASAAADRAATKATTANLRLQQLERRVEALALACQSLWEIASAELNVTEQQLLEKMQEVDLRDGKADGRMSAHAHQCSECGRNSNSQRTTCLYCGADFPDDKHIFQV